MSAPPPNAAAGALASHNPSIDEDELPVGSSIQNSRGRQLSTSPSLGDRVRSYLLSTHFQCAVQLTIGVIFLSLFVLVDKMRFPMSCQAAVIYGTMLLKKKITFFKLLYELKKTHIFFIVITKNLQPP